MNIMTQPQPSYKNQTPLTAVEKEQNLRRLMREMRSVLVAYSGGGATLDLHGFRSGALG